MTTIWNDLVDAHADLVLSGPQPRLRALRPDGQGRAPGARPASPSGSSGPAARTTTRSAPPLPGEVVSNDKTFGILKLVLHPTSYDWQFLPAPGYSFTDSGSAGCR
jgi:hypothetical protein